MKTGFLSILLALWALGLAPEKARARGAVCLYDSTDIQVRNNLTAVIKVHRSFEVTSENGMRYSEVIIPVNDYTEVQNIKGYTELPSGDRIKLAKQDIGTSSLPGFQGFGDNQVIAFSLRTPKVGSKFYYEYKLIVKSLLYVPRITRNGGFPIDRLVINLRWDNEINLRYDVDGLDVRTYDRRIHFSVSGLPEKPEESNSCPEPLQLSISTDIFNYNKTKYLSRSWPEVGRFFALLARQPENVDDEVEALAARICAGSRNLEDTLSALFSFMADSVSYVSLEMGKGDFTPHDCAVIVSRRFGDCKDQSVLLSSLFRAVGIDAYPALISTSNYLRVEGLHPWPSWFDHVITVVKDKNGDILLDPSEPLASVTALPPRLRGKNYLICDGYSDLKITPAGNDPASTIIWQFGISKPGSDGLSVEFQARYIDDAASVYRELWQGNNKDEVMSSLQNQLRRSGWNPSTLNVDPARYLSDTLMVSGRFSVGVGEIGSGNLPIASPLNTYLLDNIFSDVRKSDYCSDASLRLEETIFIDLSLSRLAVGPEFSDTWRRDGLTFQDAMIIDGERAIFHRFFDFKANQMSVTNYNAFRDFLLSRADQQYVRFEK